MEIKNIVFDMGKVLYNFDGIEFTGKYISDPEDIETVTREVFTRDIWDRLDDGSLSYFDAIPVFCARLPERLHEAAITTYKNIFTDIKEIPGMRELVASIKSKGYKIYMISNICDYYAENCHTLPGISSFVGLFDGLVLSAPLRIVKPSAEIFNYLLNKYGMKAEECVFIDDTLRNIEAAEKLGFNVYQFDGNPENLRAWLKEKLGEEI